MSTRISTSQIYNNSRNHVADAQEREAATSDKASTMKEIVRPSQAPSDWVRSANMKDQLTIQESISKNAALAQHVLTATEGALSQMQEYVQRAHELALSAAAKNPASEGTREQILGEVQNIYEAAVQTANTRYADRTLLGGLKGQGPAFDGQGNYLGDDGKFELEIERGLSIPINTSGEQAILGKGMRDGVNILDTLQRLVTGLATNDTPIIQGTLDELVQGNKQISLMRSEVGGRMNQIDRSLNTGEANKIQGLDTISKLEDADAVKTFSDLSRDQTVLRAAVETTHKILSEVPSDILFK